MENRDGVCCFWGDFFREGMHFLIFRGFLFDSVAEEEKLWYTFGKTDREEVFYGKVDVVSGRL